MKFKRIAIDPVQPHANRGIVIGYPLERASWIWHPDAGRAEPAVLRFINNLSLEQPAQLRIHLSADQRYELWIDGQRVGMGPDRAELNHWSFASYDLDLDAGDHSFDVRVWWLGDVRPAAQVTHRGGFIFTAESFTDQLQTGTGPWRVCREAGWSFERSTLETYHVVGPSETFDAAEANSAAEQPCEPVIVQGPPSFEPGQPHTGIMQTPWRLYPSPLPDMIHQPRQVGRVRAVIEGDGQGPVPAEACESPQIDVWQAMIDGTEPITIPPHTHVHAIVDLEEYYCGFTELTLRNGDRSTVQLQWAESLYEMHDDQRSEFKGDRRAVAGKVWLGFGHRVVNGGGGNAWLNHRSLWWTSGRFHRISVTTADEPVTIKRAGFVETRYPYENQSNWRSGDAQLDAIVPMAVRGIQMCSHETYTDCPYYEQMMYIGDTRVQMLIAHLMSTDDRLTRRGIELFDYSRWKTGFLAERCPSDPYQLSLTFSMIWVYMVRDYMMWRGDRAWVGDRLTGVRCLLENFLPLRNADGLLEALPGWSFVDWVDQWVSGNAPDGIDGVSSIINLQFIYALRAAAELEQWCGEQALARRYTALADRMGQAVMERFWHEPTGRLADDLDHAHFSEHAQALAILGQITNPRQTEQLLGALEHHDDLARTTVYYSFYLLEAFAQCQRGDLIQARLEFWKKLLDIDMKTPVEKPEPSRSDCHAWGSHPLFHMHCSLAGIRPDAPGFESVLIEPHPGSLRRISSDIPHPRGRIRCELRFENPSRCHAEISLPPDTSGRLAWAGQAHELKPGQTTKIQA